jgi:hypothetical protein
VPIDYHIDHERRVVFARGHGTLTDAEVFAYQGEVWSRPDTAGYDELIDFSAVDRVALPGPDRIRQLADMSAAMDAPGTEARLAIVARDKFVFGLGRMYEAYRETNPHSRKKVAVFHALADALHWLGIPEQPPREQRCEGKAG